MLSLRGVLAVALLLVLWAILAMPLLWIFTRIAARLRKRPRHSPWVVVGFAAAITLLVAPVPTPFVSVFMPHAIALLDRRYYLHILQGPPLLHELLLWNAGSMALTFVISYLWIRRTLRAPEPDGLDR
ncbi:MULTISPECIES: hypothetical protein [Xanthomonas]|uniref:hypothetical protein n=1 Tax=Xanthomonas TaxID=338 RepID=UPI000226665C|nr:MULTISPECIES: hypothetical protein [Xanthomonas]AEO41878.1 hypothetical protein XACM_1597 [Xanthomonas euvesicatoria pv. citrumelo F1]MBO9857387.1 hypothetical protein [Xanthomonas sp. A1809]MBV6805417.1 hypothetical protein [Xanthomonas campestris pv. convolvuli]MBV6856418.1 hypothetical protein [Xanthomonas campestris pv. zingibericola]MBV6895500.1 hypothetical protein [Xanthomonas campestris pv. ionidii]